MVQMDSQRKQYLRFAIFIVLVFVFVLTLSTSCDIPYDKDVFACKDDNLFCNQLENSDIKWSGRIDGISFEEAQKYCEEIGGRLPTIDELRSLIRNCPDTEPGGKCKLSEECFDAATCQEDCEGCKSNGQDGYFSIFDDSRTLWSSTKLSYGEEGYLSAAVVVFNYIENTPSTMGAVVINAELSASLRARCVLEDQEE